MPRELLGYVIDIEVIYIVTMAAAEEIDYEKLLKGITIPSPPQVVADLQLALLDPDPDLNAIAEIVSADPGLAGGVIKAANSPAFGLANRPTSVREAVFILGLKPVSMIVDVLCLKSEMDGLENQSDEVAKFMARYWDSCADIAILSAMVAEKAGVTNLRDDAYLLGLFHNVGIVLLLKRFDHYLDVMKDSYRAGSQRVVDVENEALETNHAVVGYYVAKSWKAPRHVSEAVAKHHSTKSILARGHEDEKVKTLLAVLKVAEQLSGFYKLLSEEELSLEWENVGEDALTYLGLNQDDFEDLIAQATEMGIGSTAESFY